MKSTVEGQVTPSEVPLDLAKRNSNCKKKDTFGCELQFVN